MSILFFIRSILLILGVVLLLVAVYFILEFCLSSITVNSGFKSCEKDAVEIYILTNGVHTDIVVPYKNEYKDWHKLVNSADTQSNDTSFVNVAFGWGDKGFYLDTKTWSELKFTTAFKAMFFLSSSAMHVTFYHQLQESESCKKICISKESYLKIVNYIEQSFTLDNLNNSIQIKGASYSNNDSFYEAQRTYNLFFTCNTWANSGLKAAGLKACLWTAFKGGIFKKYSD